MSNPEDLFGFATLTPADLQALKLDKIRMDWICAQPVRMERLVWAIVDVPRNSHGQKSFDLRRMIDDMMVTTGYLPG